MNILDHNTLLNFLLLPGSELVVATSAILLLQTKARKNTLIALQVALFTIIFNAFLKSIWQIPYQKQLTVMAGLIPVVTRILQWHIGVLCVFTIAQLRCSQQQDFY